MSMATGAVLDAPSPGLDLLDYGSSSDDSPTVARHSPLLLDLASSGQSSSAGTFLCSSQPTPTSTPARDLSCWEKGDVRVSPFSNAIGTPLDVRSYSPWSSPLIPSSPLGNPPQIRLLSHFSDIVIAKKSLLTGLFSTSVTEVGEGSNAG